jgi:signal peptidase II
MVSILVEEGNFIVVIPEFFKLKLHYNTGAAFSSFDGNFPFLMIMTAVATIVFIYMAKYADFKSKKFYSWGIYLMIGGMIGNFIDRVFNYGKGVVDFLAFTFFKTYDFAVFNMADTFLVIGVICIMIDILFFEAKREKKVKEIEIKE